MADPITIGMLVARVLRLGVEARIKGRAGGAVNNAYVALKIKLSAWAGDDVRALEEQPNSQAQEQIIAEVVDRLSPPDRDSLRDLAQTLENELKKCASALAPPIRPKVAGIPWGRSVNPFDPESNPQAAGVPWGPPDPQTADTLWDKGPSLTSSEIPPEHRRTIDASLFVADFEPGKLATLTVTLRLPRSKASGRWRGMATLDPARGPVQLLLEVQGFTLLSS